jgi:hypothetical protein
MSNYTPLPASGLAASWRNLLDGTTTTVALRWENEGWTADGRIESNDVQFVLRISPMWQVQQFLLFRDLDEPDLWLATDQRGRWGEVNGAHRTDLDGCVDVDLAGTPFTNCIPIRRLPLHVGHSARQNVIRIDTDTLSVVPVTQTYSMVDAHTWRYRSMWSGEEVEARVDEHGLVVSEPVFEREG